MATRPCAPALVLFATAAVVATATAQQQFQPYQFATTQLIAAPLSTGGIDVVPLTGDIDGDGRNDLVLISNSGLTVDYSIGDVLLPGVRPLGGRNGVLLHNNGNGTFADVSSRIPLDLINNRQLDVGDVDVDDDGDPDILYRNHIYALPYAFALANHLRQCTRATPLRLGQTASFAISSGPGFGQNGTAWLAAATGAVGHPFAVPGFAGQVLIDPTDPQILAVVPTSAIGSTNAFVAVPNASWLLGIGVWFEVALIPNPGVPGLPGFSNAQSGVIGP